MAFNLKKLTAKKERLAPGHRLCPGCAAPLIFRQILLSTDYPIVASNATGCLEVSTTIYPYTAWRIPWIHNAFENAAATISGVEAAYRAAKRRGKINKDIKFIAIGGDGGTYDIGIQALSGALERGHDFTYICYDNGGYMNTGNQRSGSTPRGADTTTAPKGKASYGKVEWRKDLAAIVAGHHIPYIAQTTVSNFNDLMTKAQKAIETPGPAFLNILSPCPRFWRYPAEKTIEMAKLAVDTLWWPMFEIENDKWKLTQKPKNVKPIEEWVKSQGRYSHLLKPENKGIIDEIQEHVNNYWEWINKQCEE